MKSHIIFVLLHLIVRCRSVDYIVEIGQGALNGTEKVDRNGEIFYSFQKIPFGKPPEGELRFKAPEPAGSWQGILDATEDLPACHQQDDDGNAFGQEDCLYLNVYTPQLPSASYDTLKTVMVFIYGGGFRENSGSQKLYSPEFLMSEDIVLVTINYRVGIFGSFHLENSTLGYTGNLQMKDQVLGLKWVQENIEKFGGDPNSVTIFGESAGGASVHYHILSPMSAGTFHRAILESGTALGPWTVGVPNNGILLAEVLNIATEDISAMLSELLAKSGDEIFRGQQNLTSQLNLRWGGIGYPVIEDEVEGQEAFLTQKPLSTIQSGNYNHVPMIIGYNNAEGIGYFSRYTDLYGLVPGDLEIYEDSEDANNIVNEMDNFYFTAANSSASNIQTLIELYRDVWFGYPAYRSATEHRKTTNSSIYFYRFSADTALNVYKLRYEAIAQYPGATHADDLGYLFKTHYHENMTEITNTDSVEYKAIDRITKLWTNFAKYSNPTPDDSTDFQWQPIDNNTIYYIDFGTYETMPGDGPDSEAMEFWSKIYDKYYPSSAKLYASQLSLIMFTIFISFVKIMS